MFHALEFLFGLAQVELQQGDTARAVADLQGSLPQDGLDFANGVAAPLCNNARVYVNGVYYGLYANVQTLDDEFVEALKRLFKSVATRKPAASRDTSAETYLVARGLKALPGQATG